jgi:hypothetical protein
MHKYELNAAIIAVIKRALEAGYYQHIIAGYYSINQGRVSEINRGKRGSTVPPADLLPADFPALA